MTFSVIIPAHNDRHHLVRLQPVLLPGFRAHGLGTPEIIVVANGCTDGTEALCGEAGFTCLSFEKSLTPAAARNVGVQACKGDYLIFVDADVVPREIWFRTVAKLAASNLDGVAAGFPYSVPPNWHWLAVAFEQVRMGRGRLPRYINSGNLIVSRELFDRVGGFDPVRIAGEDTDFSQRVQRAGGRLDFNPDLATDHYGESTSISGFVRRQFFHAEPLPVVMQSVLTSPMNASILMVLASTLVGVLGALLGVWSGYRSASLLVLLGPLVVLLAAAGKALPSWERSKGWRMLGQMIAASALLLTVRSIGTIWRPRR